MFLASVCSFGRARAGFLLFRLALLTTVAALATPLARANANYHSLATGDFSQDWSNAALITANDNWDNVPSIIGYLGQDITTTIGADPQGLTGVSASATDLDVIANQANPNTSTAGGVAEFAIADPTVALQGSATADAPYLLLHLNTTGRTNVVVNYVVRDIDGSADNTVQPVALQYRVGATGPFINLPAGFVADGSTGPSLATLVTPVSVTLPAAAEGQAQVQVRMISINAPGSDEWVGIDNISVTSSGTVVSGPAIVTPPGALTVETGGTATFEVVASGTAPLTYQWHKGIDSSVDIPGAESATLVITGADAGDQDYYSVTITNAISSITSVPVYLTVNPPVAPSIGVPPLAQSVPMGGGATFTVGATGTQPLAYQWYKGPTLLSDGGSISGATTATLQIYPLVLADAGDYHVVVSNGVNPDATSTPVALTVTPPAPVPAEVAWNFGTSAALTALPSSVPPDVAGGSVSSGNSLGVSTLLSTTSASTAGFSGQGNAGVAARAIALSTAANGSAYFEFSVTPVDDKKFKVMSISFGSRSTGTGPKVYTLYSSLDGFTAPLATGDFAAIGSTNWGLNTLDFPDITSQTGIELVFRLYGSGGTGSPASGTVNWRIDDLKVTGTTEFGIPIPPAVTAIAPANGATGILPHAPIVVTFNRPVSFSPTAVVVTGSTSGDHSFTISSTVPKVYTITPTSPFALGETVSVTLLASQISTPSGLVNLAADFSSAFQTVLPDPVPIHVIQGAGATSPLAEQGLVVQGIVVATFQGPGGMGGYYIEAPVDERDADPATSEGILVFDNTNSVAVGDWVKVLGSVVEFGTAPATETEISPVYQFTKLDSGISLPPATEVSLPFPTAGHPERYEGMRVTLPQTLTVTDNFTLGRFGELYLSNGRLPQPTNIVAPGAPAQAQLAANLLNQIKLDDGMSPSNPDPTPYLSSANPATATRRAGSTATGVTGAFGQKFGTYVVEPSEPVVFDEANPRPTDLPAAGPGLRVAIGNVLNFFNGNGAGGGFPTSRGANSFAEYQAQRAKIVAGILGLAPDIMGLTEVENDRRTGSASSYGADSAIADLVNGLNAGAPAGTTYAYVNAAAVDIVSDVIHCAFIYRVQTVAPVGPPAMLNDPSFTGVIQGIARNPLAQTFQQLSNGEKFTVSINHFKSKGSGSDDPGAGGPGVNDDSGDGQGASNHVRKLQAQALVNWLATDPTGSGDPDFLIIGDLNAYAKEDPIAIIEGAGYINLTEAAEGVGGYSYAFDGSFGHLDHALANGHLAGQVVDATTWHVNSDEPVYLDYNFENKSLAQQGVNAGTPYRYSDHDPVVIRLNLQPDPVAPAISAGPLTQTTTTGTNVTFSVDATGVPPPSYQWLHNGEEIEGATSSTYTVENPTSADAGSYAVVVTNSVGSVTSEPAVLTVNPAVAGVVLTDLSHVYDGTPHPASATTAPEGLPVTITYNGSAAAPVAPGWYNVVATINSPDYTGGASATLFVDVTALVRRLPSLDGKVWGSIQLVAHENATINGNGAITGDLLVPGTPTIRLNGAPTYAGTVDGAGAASPATATITLNGGASVRHVVRRTDGQAISPVAAPPAPTGTRSVVLTSPSQSPGDFATLRNLMTNGNTGGPVGPVAIPPGTYGSLIANGNSGFIVGVVGATTPAVYNLQSLALNGTSKLIVVGPVVINLPANTSLNGSAGDAGHPEWLELNIASGGLTLNGSVTFHGFVTAPSGAVTINGSSVLTGRVIADRLVVNGAGKLADPEY